MTRRKMAAAALAPAAALLAQQPPAPPADQPADPLDRARRQIRSNAATLARFDLPMAAEPAFQFKA